MTVTLATYTLQIAAEPEPARPSTANFWRTDEDKRVLSNLPAMLEAVEEDLNDLLPPGYSADIKEWNPHE